MKNRYWVIVFAISAVFLVGVVVYFIFVNVSVIKSSGSIAARHEAGPQVASFSNAIAEARTTPGRFIGPLRLNDEVDYILLASPGAITEHDGIAIFHLSGVPARILADLNNGRESPLAVAILKNGQIGDMAWLQPNDRVDGTVQQINNGNQIAVEKTSVPKIFLIKKNESIP